LPNNLEAFLLNRPVNLAVAPNDQFRAHDVAFLPDRRELAVAYDKVDTSLGKLRTAVSVIPIDVATLAATGAWQELFTSDPYSYGQGITSAGGRMAYRGDGKLYLTLGDHYTVA
jgi:hypothetical protein